MLTKAPTPIAVTLVYIADNIQEVISIFCPSGSTIQQVITFSGITEKIANIGLENVGVYGEKKPLDYVVTDGDRVEIYRPLIISPIESRRLRAASKNR